MFEAGSDRLRPREDMRPTLLLIDDDSMVGRFIAHAAEDNGYRAMRTTCIDSFGQFFRDEAPDAVAVDLCVPGRDGVEVLRFLAEAQYKGLVLIISGMDQRVLDAALRLGRALGLNMAQPLSKPFLVHEFASRLTPTKEQEPA
jgi:DNA-binding response OmpR family regulator